MSDMTVGKYADVLVFTGTTSPNVLVPGPAELEPPTVLVFNAAGAGGFNGWSPAVAIVADGERRVMQIVSWVGGTGSPPATGYIGATGIVVDIASAVDIRGPAGIAGGGGGGLPAGLTWDAVNLRFGVNQATPDATLHVNQPSVAQTDTLPGQLVYRVEHGSNSGQRAFFSLHHAYLPSLQYDMWSFRVDSGYAPAASTAFGFGFRYGEAVFITQGIGWRWNDAIYQRVANFPTTNSLRTTLPNATASWYVEDGDSDCSYSFSGLHGLRISVDYASVHLLQASKALGGIELRPRTSGNTTLRLRDRGAQTGDHVQVVDDAGTTIKARLRADGSIALPELEDSAAANRSLYYSTTVDAVTYKTSGGTLLRL